MDKREFTRTVPLLPSDNVATFKMAPGYKQYYQFYKVAEVHFQEKEYPLVQEPDMVSDVEVSQPTVRAKDNPADITWTGHTPSAQPSDISDDEDTAITPEEPRGMGLCIPISPYQD